LRASIFGGAFKISISNILCVTVSVYTICSHAQSCGTIALSSGTESGTEPITDEQCSGIQ